jgi:hypothetical protein
MRPRPVLVFAFNGLRRKRHAVTVFIGRLPDKATRPPILEKR